MNVLKSGVNPTKYVNACRVEDLDLADFESTSNYFECPLLPRRGNDRQPPRGSILTMEALAPGGSSFRIGPHPSGAGAQQKNRWAPPDVVYGELSRSTWTPPGHRAPSP